MYTVNFILNFNVKPNSILRIQLRRTCSSVLSSSWILKTSKFKVRNSENSNSFRMFWIFFLFSNPKSQLQTVTHGYWKISIRGYSKLFYSKLQSLQFDRQSSWHLHGTQSSYLRESLTKFLHSAELHCNGFIWL